MLNSKVRIYYYAKSFIPRRLQIFLRRRLVKRQLAQSVGVWPIDESAKEPPPGWTGWPGQKQIALVLTHDVDTQKGLDNCLRLADVEERIGFRSVFNFVACKYVVPVQIREELTARGFEVGLHGLYHDSSLYHSKQEFLGQAPKINQILNDWNAVGFRSPCMYHNLDWMHDLDIEYDASTFDTDPFEPQPDGVHTIFPFYVSNGLATGGYVELQYTLPQDFTIFILMKYRTIDIWTEKLEWIVQKGGMALLNTHPDYMNFDDKKLKIEEYPVAYYEEFLNYLKVKYDGKYWNPLPREIAKFWLDREARS